MRYCRVATLKTPDEFRAYLSELGVELPVDDEIRTGPDAPLAQPYTLPDGFTIGNRFCIQPMEGWDGSPDGKPTDLVRRRWRRFGQSGAKLIWGGEAVAVRHEGRANPRALVIKEENLPDLAALRELLVEAHMAHQVTHDDLLIGLQLTHSGRFCCPGPGRDARPRILYHHPVLDRKFGVPADHPVLTDAEIEGIIAAFIDAAEMAHAAGFHFVDVKHCHGYLGHEFLTAVDRPGPFGGSFENRTRFLRMATAGIRERVPELRIGVRLSAFDMVPFGKGPDGVGVPEEHTLPYPYAFGADPGDPVEQDLAEPVRFLALLEELGIHLVNITAGSPYYNPPCQRPALVPPSDGYGPPEDPLVGVARQVNVTAELKRQFPGLCMTGTAYTYLQEWLPHVGQAAVRTGGVDFIGLGRMVLSYPDLPADVLAGRPLDRRRICRTLSDCTTAPRNGLVSGCYPLDEFYKARPEAGDLKEAKERT